MCGSGPASNSQWSGLWATVNYRPVTASIPPQDCWWIQHAEESLAGIRTTKAGRAQRELSLRHPAIYQAHELFEETGPKFRNLRWASKARLLARQTYAEIAELHGCTVEAVEAYAALFFNVRERLGASDSINNCLLNPLLWSPTTPLRAQHALGGVRLQQWPVGARYYDGGAADVVARPVAQRRRRVYGRGRDWSGEAENRAGSHVAPRGECHGGILDPQLDKTNPAGAHLGCQRSANQFDRGRYC